MSLQRWSVQPLPSLWSASSSCSLALYSVTLDTFALTTLYWPLLLEFSLSFQVNVAFLLFGFPCIVLLQQCPLVSPSGLSLVVGLVLYISSINDEMLYRSKSNEAYFSYSYGWSFAFAAISFLLTEVHVCTITVPFAQNIFFIPIN